MNKEKDKAYWAWWAAWWANPEASNSTRPLFDAGWEAGRKYILDEVLPNKKIDGL